MQTEDFYGRSLSLAVDDAIDEDAVLQLVSGSLRDDDTSLLVRRQQHRATASVTQQPLRIGEYGSQGDGTSRSLYRTADGIDASFLSIDAAVRHLQLHGGSFLDEFLQRAILLGECHRLTFRDAEVGIYLLVVGHSHQRLCNTAADKSSYVIRYHRGRAVDRTRHGSVSQIVAGVDLLSLCQCEGGFGLVQLIQRSLHGIVADDLFGLQRLTALILHLCRSQLRLCRCHAGLRHLQRSLIRNLVDDKEQLTLADVLTFVDADSRDVTADLRTNLHNLFSRQSRRIWRHQCLVATAHRHGLILCLILPFLLLLSRAGCQQTSPSEEQQTG